MTRKSGCTRPGRSHHVFVCLLLLTVAATLFLGSGIPVYARSPLPPMEFTPEQVLEFAHHLFSEQEYFRAIGEYQRFLFLYPDHPQAQNAALRIVQCYFRGKRWQQALEAVNAFLRDYPQSSLRWEARFLKARTLDNLSRGEEARKEYGAIIEDQPGRPLVAEAWYLIGLSYAKEGRWLEADQALSQVGSEDLFYARAQKVQQIVAEESEARRKDPALAGFLAALVPGAGHLYCDRPRDAAIAFVFTGAFAWATYEAFNQDHEGAGVVLALITAAFYGGNIYSAANVAHKYNDRQERRQQERLAPYGKISFDQPQEPSVSLSLKYSF
ncbi:MAG: tetratricopeptide repeat protein [Syntrophobacterales bacterium]